jgi:hypothetical protein
MSGRPVAGALVGDLEPVHANDLHPPQPTGGGAGRWRGRSDRLWGYGHATVTPLIRQLALVCLTGLAGFVTPLAATDNERPADWGPLGTVPAWLSAVLTGLAFGLTFLLFLRESEDRLRKQADAVYAWMEPGLDVQGECVVQVMVRNTSEGPVWKLDVRLIRNANVLHIEPTERGEGDVLPGEESTWRWTMATADAKRLDYPSVIFDDASGRRWRRDGPSLHKEGWKGLVVKRPTRR